MESEWEAKLSPLVERDHFIREALLKRGDLSDAYHKELEKVHIENSQKLEKLIEVLGFPVLSSAGEKAVRLSWLIIQHSISRPDFLRECLMQMRLAAGDRDYPLELLAYTEDRVSFLEGRPQLYGTNFDWDDSELRATPIEDPQTLEHRRKAMGLPPFQPSRAFSEERPPKDPVRKKKEFEEWLKRVGWR